MELRQLRYFLAVAQHRNFTRAAEDVHISQPSLSVQIHALEEELGAPVFHRLGRTVELTEAGQILQDTAQRILQDVECAKETIREVCRGERGRLTIGSASTVNTYVVPLLVTKFRQHCPKVHLYIQAKPSIEIEKDILKNQLDMGLCILPASHNQLHIIPLFEEILCLVGPRHDSAGPRGKRLRLREIGRFPLILMPTDYCLRKMVDSICQQADIAPTICAEMTAPEGILEAVKQGAGWTILPELYVRHRIDTRAIQLVHLYDPIPRHPVGLVMRTNRYMGLAAKTFVTMCQATIQELKGRQSSLEYVYSL
ncbi:MAG: LysR family transcriptional regulator [Nitrospirae bacterium]|nr:MAG: LysR family transcriptional regulator [Nitrospirota bacterium]